jgi:subtilisin family serine protease
VVGTGVLALALPLVAGTAQAAPDDPSARFQKAAIAGRTTSDAKPMAVSADGRVTVVVEMKGDPVAVVQADKGRQLTAAERSSIKKDLRKKQDAIAGDLTSHGGRIQGTMQSAYNGIQVSLPAAQVDEVASLAGVVAVHPVQRYTLDNATSVPYLGIPQLWQDTGYTGKNIKVAIIDTGLDFTHATFGGPGTTEAFETANATATEAPDPALFGPDAPRVKGGYDFVGDDYDASADAGSPALTPQPDPNPLDCNGHGTHVAGTAGGGGVTADGASYTGPYDSSTASKSWLVGPGVAPEVDLYALRVFGCEGSSEVAVQAIDWAVDNGMDVINMSLGSTYGRADDPTSVASSNAVGAGVVVVASAGNEGPNPYMVGSPGSAEGVIGVSAVDSTEGFPGAMLAFGDQTLEAVNANGADLSGVGPFTVVPVGQWVDDPDSDDPADQVFSYALGCSAAEFTAAFEAAGVSESDTVIAVVSRGTCARVAKAIFGEQAGADAVVMVNTAEALPPYEGPITSNPDDGTPFVVTIPFLGVPMSAGQAIAAAEGESLTVTAAQIQNPGFEKYASFSSGGPRNGDSAIAPDVAAPGVSIASAGVGTGNGPAIISGTSMASPHVAGVAALVTQAHPGWSPEDLAAAIVGSADPDAVAGQNARIGGVGLVDAAQAVAATVTVTGDGFRTDSGWLRESALSFGFAEASRAFFGVKTITIENHGRKAVTYQLSAQANEQSSPARVTLSSRSVRVPAGGKVKVLVALSAAASDIGTSTGDDQFAFREISGSVLLSSPSGDLRVPYLMVTRPTTNVSATSGGQSWFSLQAKGKGTWPSEQKITLRNPQGAFEASADFYTWGLSDARDVPKTAPGGGYDLRAAGVQSFADGDDQLLVFAVNNYDRFSNAATNEYDVVIDTNGDGDADWILFATDSGLFFTGEPDGNTEVILYNPATGEADSTNFLATAPTDSSTVLLPVWASTLGLTAAAGTFSYSVESYSIEGYGGSDEMPGTATYNAWSPALSNGQFETVPRNGKVDVTVAVDPMAWKAQKPLGTMAVVLDNAAGKEEAILVRGR